MYIRPCLSVFIVLFLMCGHASAFDLTLLHVNDSHSYLDATGGKLKPDGVKTYVELGAWARLKTAVDDVRAQKKNVALLHAGDAVQGDLYFMEYHGKPEMEFLDRLKFDAFVLGNHEFDRGADFLARFLKYTSVPVIGANIDASGSLDLQKRLQPYVVLKYGTEKVGVIGLTTKDTAFISSPGPAVTFADEAEAARVAVSELQSRGVNKIILLTHIGLERDKQLAATVSGVDIIVGGHSHTLLGDKKAMDAIGMDAADDYPVKVKGADGHTVYVVQAWKWARVLGQLDVTFDARGNVTAVTGQPVILVGDTFKRKNEQGKKLVLQGEEKAETVAAVNASPVTEVVGMNSRAQKFLKPYSEGVKAMRSDVIGTAAAALPHIRVPGVTESGLKLPHGSLIAPVVCDAMLARIDATGDPADIAIQNAGGVRESIPQGNITVGTAYTLLPFNNTLHVLELTGAQIKEALEFGVYKGSGAFPYAAGLRYTVNMNKPQGQRVSGVVVRNKDAKWVPLKPTRTYRVVTNAYMARGGDGYAILLQAAKGYDTGFVDALAFIEYVKKNKVIEPPSCTGVTYIPAR